MRARSGEGDDRRPPSADGEDTMSKFRIGARIAAIVGAIAIAASCNTVQSQSQQEAARPFQGPGAERAARYPVKLHPHDIKSTFIRVPLPAGQEQYGRIQGERLKEFVEEISAISRRSRDAGDLMWGRMAGTTYDDMTEALVESRFREWGLQNIRRQYFTLEPQWFPTAWDFRVTGSGETLTFESLQAVRGAGATPPGGLDLDVVWVGLGNETDFQGRNVKGVERRDRSGD
jgi:hypothetical protein